MVEQEVMLDEVIQKNSEEKCFSWSVPGNPIGCKVPKEFESKDIELSVLWGISPGYTVTAGLLDASIDELVNSCIEVGRVQSVEELQNEYPELFLMKGTFYVM